MLSMTEKEAFFQILFLKSLLLFGVVTDYYRRRTEKKSHCSMYTKSKDFSTVCKEIKQTDLKTNLWFRSSIQCIIKLGWKVQSDVGLIISTATVSTEISAVI